MGSMYHLNLQTYLLCGICSVQIVFFLVQGIIYEQYIMDCEEQYTALSAPFVVKRTNHTRSSISNIMKGKYQIEAVYLNMCILNLEATTKFNVHPMKLN